MKILSTKLYMAPAFGATTACHAMNQVKTGLRVYIRPLGGPQLCPGLDAIRARSPHEHTGLVWADNVSRVCTRWVSLWCHHRSSALHSLV